MPKDYFIPIFVSMESINALRLCRGLYYIVLFDNEIFLADFKESTVPIIVERDLTPVEIQMFEIDVDCKTIFENGDYSFLKRSIRVKDIYAVFPKDRLVSRLSEI